MANISRIKTPTGTYNVYDDTAMRATDLKNAVAEAISGYTAPVFVDSTGAMTDTEKIYVLTSNGHIYAYSGGWKDTGLVYGAYIAQDKLPVTGNPMYPLSIIERDNPLNTPGYYFGSDGSQKQEAVAGTYWLSPYIPVEPSTVLFGWLGTSTAVYCNFYNEQYMYISSANQGDMTGGAGSTNPGLLYVPSTAHYIRCTIPSRAATANFPIYLVPAYYNSTSGTFFPSIGEFARACKSGWVSDDISPVYYNNPDNIQGYLSADGRVMTIYNNATYRITPAISCTPTTFYRASIGNSANAYVAFLDREMHILSTVSQQDVESAGGFTTPEKCEYFRATLQNAGAWICRGTKYAVPSFDSVLDSIPAMANTPYEFGVVAAQGAVFSESFNGDSYTHTFDLYPAATITITNAGDNVRVQVESQTVTGSYTASGNIAAGSVGNMVYIIPTDSGCQVIVTSSGNMFTFDLPGRIVLSSDPVYGCYGSPLSPVWIVGDSYMTIADNRVGGHIDTYNAFVMAFSGATPTALATHLNTMLTKTAPKIIVWLAGMNGNNADNIYALSTASALAAQYKSAFVPAVVPSVPDRVRTEYNNKVREYSHYIDWSRAVQASDGSTAWYSGLLDSDNIHPTIEGAKRLALEIVANVPSIVYNP